MHCSGCTSVLRVVRVGRDQRRELERCPRACCAVRGALWERGSLSRRQRNGERINVSGTSCGSFYPHTLTLGWFYSRIVFKIKSLTGTINSRVYDMVRKKPLTVQNLSAAVFLAR